MGSVGETAGQLGRVQPRSPAERLRRRDNAENVGDEESG